MEELSLLNKTDHDFCPKRLVQKGKKELYYLQA